MQNVSTEQHIGRPHTVPTLQPNPPKARVKISLQKWIPLVPISVLVFLLSVTRAVVKGAMKIEINFLIIQCQNVCRDYVHVCSRLRRWRS